jgi:hypothetical protein
MAAYMTAMLRATAASPDWPAYKTQAPPSPKAKAVSFNTMLLQILLPSLDRAASVHYQCLGDRRLAAVCLAARLYAADHGGRLPASLQDLVPDYLPSVPLDPFAGGAATLRYVNEAADPQHPRVYGVGENGIDHGGVEPDPMLTRTQLNQISDQVRHLKRQPRPKPEEPGSIYPGFPGGYPGGPPPGFPGAPPGDQEEVEDEPARAKTSDADEPAGDTPAENAPRGGASPPPPVVDAEPRSQT